MTRLQSHVPKSILKGNYPLKNVDIDQPVVKKTPKYINSKGQPRRCRLHYPFQVGLGSRPCIKVWEFPNLQLCSTLKVSPLHNPGLHLGLGCAANENRKKLRHPIEFADFLLGGIFRLKIAFS